jgi:hypothetical protein
MMVGKTFPLKLDFATCTTELSCILVPDPIWTLFASPEISYIKGLAGNILTTGKVTKCKV